LRQRTIFLYSLLSVTLLAKANDITEEILELKTSGELRVGAIEVEDDAGDKTSTLSLGGKVGLNSKPINGFTLGATFYTTNALFGKDSESMFLDSNSKSYSIVGEAYLQTNFEKTSIKVGRQLFDSPFINGDDIGMIPNTIEGYTLVDKTIPNTTVIMGYIDSWAGVDAPKPERFTKMQESDNGVILLGTIYEGLEHTTLQAWHYKLEKNSWNYLEASYEQDGWSVAGQYANQGEGNTLYGFDGQYSIKELTLHTAYNEVHGVISNGFGGGPFFTSSEDHTVHETLHNKAKLMGAEYNVKDITLSLTHVNFSKCEDETDYIASYALNESLSMDLIYSDMNHDGKMSRFFVNYSF